jgi:hypothetical protein
VLKLVAFSTLVVEVVGGEEENYWMLDMKTSPWQMVVLDKYWERSNHGSQ